MAANSPWFSRERLVTLALILAFLLALYVCWQIVSPFLTSLAWALALAILGHPIHERLSRAVPSRGLAAALAVALVAVILIAPVVFVAQAVVSEAAEGLSRLREATPGNLERSPVLTALLRWLPGDVDIGQELERGVQALTRRAPSVVLGSLWAAVQLLVTLYSLFFFFRDRRAALAWVRRLIPLSSGETGEVFRWVEDTIYGTIYGYLTVAMIQGTLGGLMFWWLGLPAPLLWGAAMAVMSAIPVLGAPVIWLPTAVYLAFQGDWKSAVILSAWGATAVGLIDNLLYPMLVGKRLRLHTLPVFFAIVGGIILLGVAGVILGPLALAIAVALFDILRRRTSHGHTAEEPSSSS
jgi:predicted PurR-regulated permease PerM